MSNDTKRETAEETKARNLSDASLAWTIQWCAANASGSAYEALLVVEQARREARKAERLAVDAKQAASWAPLRGWKVAK